MAKDKTFEFSRNINIETPQILKYNHQIMIVVYDTFNCWTTIDFAALSGTNRKAKAGNKLNKFAPFFRGSW